MTLSLGGTLERAHPRAGSRISNNTLTRKVFPISLVSE